MDWKKRNSQFEKIYQRLVDAIYRFVYFKVSDFELAKDITADTFLRFWKTFKNGKKIRNDKTFLYLIARGLIIDYYRKKSNRRQISIDKIDEELLLDGEESDNSLDRKAETDELFAKLKGLKKEYGDILILYYIEELKIPEISAILDKKENTVRVLIHRALKALKKKYE